MLYLKIRITEMRTISKESMLLRNPEASNQKQHFELNQR